MSDGRFGLGKTGSQTESAYISWSRRTFDSLNEGGVWGVPRSGLIFTRRGETLVLTDLAPWHEEMSVSKEDWMMAQMLDYDQIKGYMEKAGITVLNDRRSDG